jgi:hypothetical protein
VRWCVATLVLAACQFNSNVENGGDADSTSTGATTTSATSLSSSSTSVDVTGSSTDTPTTSTATTETTETTDATTSSEGSSSTGSNVQPFEVGPFDTPTTIEILNSPSNDDDPTLRTDTLEIYFASSRNGSEEIFRSERMGDKEDWLLPEPVAAFDTFEFETTPELSPDGLSIVLAIQDFDSETDLFISTRGSVDSLDWSELQPIEELNTEPGDLGLTFTEDLFTGYFCRRDTVGARLFRATRDREQGPFDVITELTLDGEEYECNPWIDAAGSTLVFGSGDNDDERDIVFARVDGEGFEPTQVVDSVSTTDDENDPWLSPDGGLIVFSRFVAGQQDLLWASRP